MTSGPHAGGTITSRDAEGRGQEHGGRLLDGDGTLLVDGPHSIWQVARGAQEVLRDANQQTQQRGQR